MGEQDEAFLSVTFAGGRFDRHSIPVNVLAELATVQQLLALVARRLFLRDHEGRKRVPRGFFDAGEVQLFAAEHNCFTAVLSRSRAEEWRPPDPLLDRLLFDRARDVTIKALAAAADRQTLPPEFPHEAFDLLGALGRNLDDDENLFVRGTAGTGARIDQASRGHLARMTQRPLEREQDVEGEVDELDDVARRVCLRTSNGRVVVPFQVKDRGSLVDALRDRPIVRVRARGTLVLASQQIMKGHVEIEVIDHDRAPDVLKVWLRLADLANLTDGWLSGDGQAPTERAVGHARAVLGRLLVEQPNVPAPKVYPTPDGGIQAEWVLGAWAAEARFAPDDDEVTLEATNGDTLEDREKLVPAGALTGDEVTPLARWLAELGTEGRDHV